MVEKNVPLKKENVPLKNENGPLKEEKLPSKAELVKCLHCPTELEPTRDIQLPFTKNSHHYLK